ncbi:MAG: S8 family serine peptidase [Clostridia bacterium]|nr:S8 family serine peptidase [Clostridia bacterium]
MKSRKLISLLLAFLLVFSMFTACGKKEEPVIEPQETIPASIRPEIDEAEVKAFEEYLVSYEKLDEYVDFSKVDIEAEYAISRVIVEGKPFLEGAEPLAMCEDGMGFTLVQFGTPEEAKAFSELQKEHGITAFEDELILTYDDVEYDEEPVGPLTLEDMGWLYEPLDGVNLESALGSWGTTYTGSLAYANLIKERGRAGTEIIVAVVDDGVDVNHKFLAGRLVQGYNYIENNGIQTPLYDHGTHIAGTIVDNTPGLNVKIMPVRSIGYLWDKPAENQHKEFGTATSIANGIRFAVYYGASVVNCSFGGERSSSEIYKTNAIREGLSKGVVFCVAAGNDNQNTSNINPGCLTDKGVIVTAAIDSAGNKASFSNFGASVDIAAPGVAIRSSLLFNKYGNMNGTSMATPHVTAAAAMVKIMHPEFSPADVENFLTEYATDAGAPGRDDYFGYGILNLFECDRKNEVVEIAVRQLPDVTEYYLNDELKRAGLVVAVKYTDGSIKLIRFTGDSRKDFEYDNYCAFSNEKFTKPGKATVTVVVEGKSAAFEVNVLGEERPPFPALKHLERSSSNFSIMFSTFAPEASAYLDNASPFGFGEDFSGDGLTFDPATNTITLNNVRSGFLTISGAGNDLKIKVVGSNTLNFIHTDGWDAGGSIKFIGDGSLNIKCHPDYGKDAYGDIELDGELTDCCLMIGKGLDITVERQIGVCTTTLKDNIFLEKNTEFTGKVLTVEDPKGTSSRIGDWYINMVIDNCKGTVPMMYHTVVTPENGAIHISTR